MPPNIPGSFNARVLQRAWWLTLFLLAASPILLPSLAEAALGVVQSTSVPTSGDGTGVIAGANETVTFGSNTASGNLIVVIVSLWDNGGSVASVTDNKSNSYTQALQADSGNARVAVFYAENISGGSNHQVTVNQSGTIYGSFSAIEVSGAAKSYSFDTGATATNVTDAGAFSHSITSGTLAQASEIVFAVSTWDNGGVISSLGSPWSVVYNRQDTGLDHNGAADYRIISATSALTATWSATATCCSLNRASGIAAFKAAPEAAERATLSKPPNNLGLVGYWSFNEGTSTTATDFSGNGNTGTFENSPTWTNGKRGKAPNFDAANERVNVPQSSSLDITGTLTIALWLKAESVSGDHPYVAKNTVSSPPQYFLGLTGDELDFCITGGACTASTNANLTAGRWYHIAATYSDAANAVTLYVDGVPVADDAGAAETGSISASIHPAIIGAAYNISPDATLDEVRIYSRVLGASEARSLYGSGAVKFTSNSKALTQGSSFENGLVGLWTFDGADVRWTSATAGVAYDRSGNNNTGTLTNMSQSGSPALGKLGQALRFDGTDDRVNAGNSASLQVTGSLSATAWVRFSTLTGDTDHYVVSKFGSTGDNDASWALVVNGNANVGTLSAYLTSDGGGGTFVERVAGTTFAPNEWHHVAMVYNTSGQTLTVYVDGVAANGSLSGTVPASIFNSSRSLWIGVRDRDPSGDNFANGSVDDVRAYNRALSPAEVKQLYKLGQVIIRQ